jgi:hypothetical protein
MAPTEREWSEWAAEHNMGEIVRFHNVVRACLAEKADEFSDDKIVKSSLENYMQHLATNGFLMVYAYVEEWLCIMWKRIAPGEDRPRGSGIQKYAKGLKACGLDLGSKPWRFIGEASHVRHCLLHANGRLDYMVKSSRHTLEAIVARYPGELDVQHQRLRVQAEFTGRFVEEVRAFRDAVWEAVGRGEQS